MVGKMAWAWVLVGLVMQVRTGAGVVGEPVVMESSGGVLAYSPDGKLLAAAADYKGPLKLWDVKERKELAVLQEGKAVYTSLAFAPDGKALAAVSVSLDPAAVELSVWDLPARRMRPNANGDPRWSAPKWARYSPDGRVLATGHFAFVRLLDARTGRELRQLPAHAEALMIDGAYSANGKILAAAGQEDKTVRVWDGKTGAPLRAFTSPGEEISCIAVSPDGTRVAVGQKNSVSVFDAANGKAKWNSSAHTDSVMSLAFSPDGKMLVSASHDGTARLWDVAAGKEVEKVTPERGTVQAAVFSPDGKALAVGTSAEVGVYPVKR